MATEVAKPVVYPGLTGEEHPEIFTTPPTPPPVKNRGQLPDHLIKQYFEEGYVVVEDFFRPEELEPCRKAIEEEVDKLAQRLHAAGKLKSLYEDKGLFERLTCIEADFPGANIILHKLGRLPQAFRDLWSNERMLNVIEQLIGPEIAGSPVWNLRTKTPQNEATVVPWHQDSAYFDNESYKVFIPTAWIPLLDADVENGCMEVAERGHRKGTVAKHGCCYGNTWYVMLEEDEMAKTLGIDPKKDFKVCPVRYGGMLLINNMIPHRSLPNVSDKIRWSLDLRWQRPDLPMGLFGLKEGVLMRTAKIPNHVIDWEPFDSVDRNQEQKKYCKEKSLLEVDESELDTTIQGPWMEKWELIHLNRHTTKYTQDADKWDKN